MRHYGYPRLSPWVAAIKEQFGKEWFRFSQLPDHLYDRSNLIKSQKAGLLERSKGYTGKGNNRRMWRVK